MMAETNVRSGSRMVLGPVDGDLHVGRNVVLSAEDGKSIFVTGTAYLEVPVKIEGSLLCRSLQVRGRGYRAGDSVTVVGDLRIEGDADVLSSIDVAGGIKAANLGVGGHLMSGSLSAKNARVGGHLETKGSLEAENLTVGGHLTSGGAVKINNLCVGGHAEIAGGTITGEIKVMGHLTTQGSLEFGELEVLGHLDMPGGTVGRRLVALGKVSFHGDASFGMLEVRGVVNVDGDCTSEHIDVTGVLKVLRSLTVAKELVIAGVVDSRERVRCQRLTLAGRLAVNELVVDDLADISGEVLATVRITCKSIITRKGSRINGAIVADTAEVGVKEAIMGPLMVLRPFTAKTKVKDIYANKVILGRNARAERVFGRVVELHEASAVGELQYTEELNAHGNYHTERAPVRVERLPQPPS
ncbi:MAG TPA: hypothetical protein VEH08_02765 [Methanomassiliicoccales archaeon]|nr:hypothetical protein [Methanomassiliicoccales archaeon]